MTDKPPTAFEKAKALVKKKREELKKTVDERWRDVQNYQESEQERFERIMDDPTAWNNL